MKEMIEINGIRCRCRVGVPAAERRSRQEILVDAAFPADVRRAAQSDDFRLAVDYEAVERAVRTAAEAGEFKLVERLAESAAAAVFACDRRIRAVEIAVRKSPAAMPRCREVVVRIARRRR